MNKQITQVRLVVVLAALGIGLASAAQSSGLSPTAMGNTELEKLVGQPVDIAPWAYAWRTDRAVQESAEAYFIPRRLERIDRVYRTAFTALPQQQLKSIYYDMQDLLRPLPPPPKGRLQAGLLWTGGVTKYQVELHWPAGAAKIPSPEGVEVRAYPTSFGWFGWTVDQVLSNPEISGDRRTWTYKSNPAAKMDGGLQCPARCRHGNGRGVLRRRKARKRRKGSRTQHSSDRSEPRRMEADRSGDGMGIPSGKGKDRVRRAARVPCGYARLRVAIDGRQGNDGHRCARLAIAGRGGYAARHRRAGAVCSPQSPGFG